ncbi:hypothetical protein HK102_000707 [Quaeritorhiza haematococci]|nr:hypothetical protein HK102_000707 [Quaeritorhiza haematococci]
MNTMLSSNAPVFTPATTQSPSVGTGGARQIPLTCTGHTRPVVDLSFSAYVPTTREYYLISACKDGIPILRKGSTGDWIGSFQGHKGAVWSARLSLDATLSVTGSADFSAKLWANNRGDALLTYPHRHVVRTVDISSDNRYILTGGLEKKVRIFDLQSQATDTPLRCLEGNENEVKTALLDGVNGIVFNGDGKTLRVWDLRSSAQVSARAFDDEITQLRFDWDRKYIICTAGKAVYFYNAVT